MTQLERRRPARRLKQASHEVAPYLSGDDMGNLMVAATVRYWKQFTPASGDIDASTVPPDFVWVDTDGAVLTGAPADDPAASTTTPALPSGRWVEFSFATITAISAGNVWVGWYRKPVA